MLETKIHEPFLVLLLSITLINIILITKIILGRNKITIFRATGIYPNNLTNVIPVESELRIEPRSRHIQLIPNHMSKDSVSIKTVNTNLVANDGRLIRGCKYCLAFYRVGTVICPNCGGPLNISS